MARPKNLEYNKSIFKPGDTHILHNTLNKKEKANIYFISTPGQMLSAIEAQNHFQTKNNILVILFFVVGDGKYINQMFKLSELFPYDMLMTYQNRNTRNIFAYSKYLKHLKEYNYDYAFIGYHTILYRRMVANINFNKLFLLDSGENIIDVHTQLCSENSTYNSLYKSFKDSNYKGKLAWIQYYLLGYKKDRNIDDISFFTNFDIEPFNKEKIIKHKYEYVKDIFGEDINQYSEKMLSIFNLNINGHKNILAKRRMIDMSIDKKSMVSATGISLELFPDMVKTVKGYSDKLINNIIAQEKSFYSVRVTTDKEFLKKLQHALIFKDSMIFQNTLNLLLEIFSKRLFDILSNQSINILRLNGILSTLNEALKLYIEGKNRFDREIKINNFYELFNILINMSNTRLSNKEKISIVNYLVLIYSNYMHGLKNENNIVNAYVYLEKNTNAFKHKLIDLLCQLPDSSSDLNSNIPIFKANLYSKYISTEKYKNSLNYLYQTLILGNNLNQDIERLSKYFIYTNKRIQNISKHIKALGILLEHSTDSNKIKNRVWDIYSKAVFDRKYRIEAGLLIVKDYCNNNSQSKATKLYFQILKSKGIKTREEALLYMDKALLLKLHISNREHFEELYNKYIFVPFLSTNNSDVILDFFKFQSKLVEIEKQKKIEYTNRPKNLEYNKSIFKPGDTHILHNTLNKKEKANIYFISTPGQMLSAIEAQNHFQTKNNILVILFFVVGDGKNINQMFKLSELFPYDMLMTYQNKSAKFYISLIPFLKLLKEYQFNYLFFGFNTMLYRRIVANMEYKQLFYLDDGVHTITTHEDIYNDKRKLTRVEYKAFPKTLNFLKVLYIYGKNHLKADKSLSDLNFFTVYNIEKYQNEKIIKHDFSYTRSLFIGQNLKDDNLYVLGQPLVEQVGVDQLVYHNYLFSLFEFYKDKNIIFIPHRLEKLHENLKSHLIRNQISLFIPDKPIEFYFLYKNIYPGYVASFITSALFNINKLFPKTEARAFEIDIKELDKHHQQGISLIYQHYRNEDIKIIDMKKYLIEKT
ncbi:MAG: Unknown protein [uncultured Sulfurovum sp.]|uniref:Glycosyltransferase n=1 Tax=uncultured Sulfurovum sp. TaxID=269237 RepID=A0A6S6U173_9BACT|nr:MAG: Unknown protein [uncultured Sulfurovum sp.]